MALFMVNRCVCVFFFCCFVLIKHSYLPAGEGRDEPVGIQSATCGPQGAAAPPHHHSRRPGSGWAPVTPTSRWLVYFGRSWWVHPPWTGFWDRPGRWCTETPRSFPRRRRSRMGDRSWNKPEFCRRTLCCSACPPWSSSVLGSLF